MDIINREWNESVIISRLGSNLNTILSQTYRSLHAVFIFIVLLVYEFIMCIVEAMLQVANPDLDLRRSSVTANVATVEQKTSPVLNTAIKSTKIIAFPASMSHPHRAVASQLQTPEPTILIPEIVPFVSIELSRSTSSLSIESAPVTPTQSSISEKRLSISSILQDNSQNDKFVEMSTTQEDKEKCVEILKSDSPVTPPPTPAETVEYVGPTIHEIFKAFAKFGDCKSDGSAITLSNSDKWFKQAQLFDGKTMTTTDSGIYWKQVAKTKRSLSYTEYLKFLEALAKAKKLEIIDLKAKLKSSGPPSTSNATHAQSTGAFSRLTDHTKYTGSHKQRFDESGKGRGKAGREDIIVNTGYVNGFKQ